MAVYYSGGGGFPWAKLLGMATAPLTGGVPLLSLLATPAGGGTTGGGEQVQDMSEDPFASDPMALSRQVVQGDSTGQGATRAGLLDLAAAPWIRYMPPRRW